MQLYLNFIHLEDKKQFQTEFNSRYWYKHFKYLNLKTLRPLSDFKIPISNNFGHLYVRYHPWSVFLYLIILTICMWDTTTVCFTQMEIKLLIYSKDRVYKLLCIILLENHRRNHAEIKFVEVLFGIYNWFFEIRSLIQTENSGGKRCAVYYYYRICR